MKKIMAAIYFIYVIFMTSFGDVYSVEWDCASTTINGTFTRSTDCTISGSNHVAVANTLEIVGTNTDMNNLIKITAAANNRHFYLSRINVTLTLRYLKLIGGDPNSSPNSGGVILAWIESAKINLYSCILENNKGNSGGTINLYPGEAKNIVLNVFDSSIINNEATGSDGGAIYSHVSEVNVHNSLLKGNKANYYGGAICIFGGKGIIRNTTFAENTALNLGGGISISKGFSNAANKAIINPASVNISSCTFDSNRVTTTTTSYNGGGAIYIQRASNTIDNFKLQINLMVQIVKIGKYVMLGISVYMGIQHLMLIAYNVAKDDFNLQINLLAPIQFIPFYSLRYDPYLHM
eukprot:g10393.t1